MKVIASIFVLTLLFCFPAFSSDGSHTKSGNHLIPISDKNIQVKKEILTIKRNDRGVIEVSVYYVFLNNGPEKEIIVGYEAFPAFNTDLQYSKDGAHPYMNDFSIHLNGSYLPYQVPLVDDTLYKTRESGVINAVNFDKVRTQFGIKKSFFQGIENGNSK